MNRWIHVASLGCGGLRSRRRMGSMPNKRFSFWLAVGLAGLLAVAASGDTVYLVGGGSYKGKVREEGDRVIVEIPGGSMTIDRDRVARIEYSEDLYVTLGERRRQLDSRDAAGHYKLGEWALANGLVAPARELLSAAIKIQPDHGPANVALGRVFLDSAWCDPETLQERLNQWLDGGQEAIALQVARQALSAALSPACRRSTLEAAASASRRLGYFSQSLAYYRDLQALTAPADPQFDRLAAIADVLKECPAGLYLVAADELAQLGRAEGESRRRSGFRSLSEDTTLEWALRDRAKSAIVAGQGLMASAKAAEVTDSSRPAGLYGQADEVFGRAESLNPGIARSYRIEVRRRLIQIHQASAEALALRFDGLNKQLPVAVKSRQTYRNQLKTMQTLLDDIEKELEQALALASAYPQELILIITWTHEDLAMVKAMRWTLENEQDQLK